MAVLPRTGHQLLHDAQLLAQLFQQPQILFLLDPGDGVVELGLLANVGLLIVLLRYCIAHAAVELLCLLPDEVYKL